MHNKLLIVATNLLLVALASCSLQPPLVDNNFGTKDEKLKAEKQQKFPPCKSCTLLIESFNKVRPEILPIKAISYLIACRA